MFEVYRADIHQARKVHLLNPNWFSQNIWVHLQLTTLPVTCYRFERWARQLSVPVVRHLIIGLAVVLRYWIRFKAGVFIAPQADLGPGFAIHTLWGIYVGAVKIGKNCIVQTGVLIHYEVKEIGDGVYFGPGSKVIGSVKVGNNVTVVANSLVVSDIPDNCTVMGVPATVHLPRIHLPKVYFGKSAAVQKH